MDRSPPARDALVARERALNALILEGRLLDAFERHYAEHVIMQEPGAPATEGKASNRQRQEGFLNEVARIDEVTLLSTAVGDDVTLSEWRYAFDLRTGTRLVMEQVAVRRWLDGFVVHERFYYDRPG